MDYFEKKYICLFLPEYSLMLLRLRFGILALRNYETELRNRITQNDVTLPVTNLKILTEILLSSY